MGLGWLLLALASSAQPTEFHLETDTPDALCPELRLTREAVKKRLGQLDVDGGGTWQGRYNTVHDPSGRNGDVVRLVIIDPSGKEQLTRDLPMHGESCGTMAQAIALVVDSFFRDFGQTPVREPAKDTPRSTPTPTATPATTPPPQAFTNAKDNASLPAPHQAPASSREHRASLGLLLGGGYESVPSGGAATVGVFSDFSTRFRWELRAAFPSDRVSETYGPASAHLYPIPIRLSFSYRSCRDNGLCGFVGPELLLSLERGSAEGVPTDHEAWRESLGAGVRTGVAIWLSPEMALAANLSLDTIAYQSRRFLVVTEPALEVSRVRWAGTLEFWGVVFQ